MSSTGSCGRPTTLNRLVVVDTSLRDWDVPCDCTIAPELKLSTAKVLAGAGVDVIEAGIPARSASSFGTVSMVAREIQGPIVGGLSSCNRAAIELTARALKPAHRPRIHIFLSAAFVHVALDSSMERELLSSAMEGVRMARDLTTDVEFSASDFTTIDWAFLVQVIETVLDEGASTVNISDSSGRIVPEEVSELIRHLRRYVRDIQRARLSVRCGNQFGVATANSLAAISAGARQVVCALPDNFGNAGSGSLQELLAILEMRQELFQATTGVRLDHLIPIPSSPKDFLDFIGQRYGTLQFEGAA